jgi:hypothetical protein
MDTLACGRGKKRIGVRACRRVGVGWFAHARASARETGGSGRASEHHTEVTEGLIRSRGGDGA